jgi:glycosyltransferase involved in cell wall biosynthesis
MMTRKKVLMVAYACNPKGGGEHWLGWGWAQEAARNHEVWLLTTPKHASEVQESAEAMGIHPVIVSLSPTLDKICKKMGGLQSWLRKYLWQYEALRTARKLHATIGFDIVHQTTFHTFRVPMATTSLGVASVWGPMAGGESVPKGYEIYLGKGRIAESFRNVMNRLCLYHPGVQSSLSKASRLLVSNRTTAGFLPERVRNKCVVVAPNALRNEDMEQAPLTREKRVAGARANLIYVGNCVNRRGLFLAFEVMKRFWPEEAHLKVVGSGPDWADWNKYCEDARLMDRVEFTGAVDSSTVRKFYDASDALMFPSLRDSGGSPLLEAMTRGLPVICLDWAGPGEMVNQESAFLLPANDPSDTLNAMEAAIRQLINNPESAADIIRAARERALDVFSWSHKGELLDRVYEEVLNESKA